MVVLILDVDFIFLKKMEGSVVIVDVFYVDGLFIICDVFRW